MDKAGWRPISVSANGSGADSRFASIWLKDGQYGKDWSLRHNLTTAQYAQQVNDLKGAGLRPVVVDLYNTQADPRYAAIWIPDGGPFRNEQALNQEEMQEKIDEHAAAGYRPVWVSGLGSSASNDPIFAGLWVRDSITGTMRIGLTRDDINAEGLARTLVNDGFRLAHLSGYETEEGIRYAGVWTRSDTCQALPWEGFRAMTSTQFQVKASAQRSVSSVKTVGAETISLEPGDLGQTFRISRVALRHDFGSGQSASLARIQAGAGVSFQNGDILILQVEPGHIVQVNERENGNISLRRPGYTGASGQSFNLDDHQYRLTLQFHALAGRWVELQRNNLSPDYYWPSSVDEFFVDGGRRYNSVWQAGPSQRVWQVTGEFDSAASNVLQPFDGAMRAFMRRHNIPNGSLAITVDGRLVLSRGYSWDWPGVEPAQPDALFRIASLAKPLTSIGIMRLVQQRRLNLDWRLIDVPGFDAVLKSNQWADGRIRNATVRDLLHHLGGWDRDDGVGDYMLQDWNICEGQNPLPTTRTRILDYARPKALDSAPGTTHVYSNFGYMLLGMIIETVSGQSYYDFMKAEVLQPSGANASQLGMNFLRAKNEVRYYKPDNAVGSIATGLSIINPPPAYNPCNWQHAFLSPIPYGTYNIEPMDAHGGWIASTVDLAKIMRSLDNDTLIDARLRREMLSRPDGRSRRMVAYDQSNGQYRDLTLRLRSNDSISSIALDEIGDILIVGRGLARFSRVDLQIDSPGQGYTLQVIYPSTEGGWKPLTGADSTNGLSGDGSLSFDAPLDWEPITLDLLVDDHPRYYLIIYTSTDPTMPAVINQALPSGETNYALGWRADDPSSASLAYKNRIGTLTLGSVLVGEISRASATIDFFLPDPIPTSGVMLLSNLSGGPFYPDEKLLISNAVVATANDREWAVDANASHGGLLGGTWARMQHRTDGVNWVVLFNQDNAYDPYWYLPTQHAITATLQALADEFTNEGKWPAFDLFD
jgi:N-acyl-D-amino-acid deacylase